jgi:hypothetical protein
MLSRRRRMRRYDSSPCNRAISPQTKVANHATDAVIVKATNRKATALLLILAEIRGTREITNGEMKVAPACVAPGPFPTSREALGKKKAKQIGLRLSVRNVTFRHKKAGTDASEENRQRDGRAHCCTARPSPGHRAMLLQPAQKNRPDRWMVPWPGQ